MLVLAAWSTAEAQPRAIYQQTQYQGQEIGRLTGDVYYARMDDYLSVFMVTPDGIVLVEPISSEFATWLKGELATRFKVPVKYVIYSHHHWDHASGASVWADTARIVGHEAMMKRLAMPPAGTPLPQNARAQDTNGNGQIEAAEAQGNIKAQFALYDANRDNALSGAEVTRGPLAFVRPPDLTYTGPITITLGGKRVEVLPRPDRARRRQHHRAVRGRHQRAVRLRLDHQRPRALRRRRRHEGGAGDRQDGRRAGLRPLRLQPRAAGQEGRRRRQHQVPRGAARRRGQGRGGGADPGAGAGQRDDGRVQGLGVLPAAAARERGGHLSRAAGGASRLHLQDSL